MTQQDDITQRPLTGDETRAAVREARSMTAPSDTTEPGDYVMAGARALLSKLRAPVADEHCSACNPQVFSIEQLEKDPLLVARLWRNPADTDRSLVERILEHVSEYGESMASSPLLSVRTIARRNLEARIEAELADAMRSQDESPLREALTEIASAWSARTRLPEEDGIQALKDIARAALASAPVAGEAQKPVAWMKDDGSDAWTDAKKKLAEQHAGTPGKIVASRYTLPLYAAPQASAENALTAPADVTQLVAFIFDRFGQPGDAGALPDNVAAAVRRLERGIKAQADKDGGQQRAGDVDERAAFEAWAYRAGMGPKFRESMFAAWEARAALSAPQAEQGERDA